METLNMTWVNLLRMQFIEILEFYDENPERFQYKELKKAYDALLSVKSVEEFKQWRKLLKDYGLSFTDMDGTAHKDNQLGILDDYAEGANDKILDVFIRWKLSFNPLKWTEMENWNRELVDILLKATKREEDVHIVIFPCGKPNAKRWAAVGQDADRLFEVFGWQTGHVNATNGPVSWMFINGYGLDVLRQSGYSIQIRDFGEFDILSTAFEEDSVASLQQFIDYLRMMDSITQEQVNFLKKIRPIIFRNSGYWELTHGNISYDDNGNVYVEQKGKKPIILAQGKNWRLDKLTRPLVVQMGEKLGEA
ncbi:hypothetical protein [Hallella mizrahii]|uniref:Uncharacterized protein n=1 Tax=Hallella mizrahii TaxID=2606637 RepID=A0A7K0KH97_9BACT|nr:hypothetical protein [Hallella mizrahii]MST85278.1 hypothetical protein [Hallella mizrahii]